MNERPVLFGVCLVLATLIAFSSVVVAGEVGQVEERTIYPGNAAGPFGVPLTPAVYLVNFLLLYMANPDEAAFMPAYRATIPLPLYDCLKQHPEGCPYAAFARFFDDQVVHGACFWPRDCRENPRWEVLAPDIARHPDQVNEPLGIHRADTIARFLGIDASMILTDAEYQCTIGTPPRNQDQETIYRCIMNLTNSKGNTDIPLSSYGLSITDRGDVQSDCAPEAPCLVFNQLFAGPLEKIAYECGWATKLASMARETPFFHLVDDANTCQRNAEPVCVVEPICRPFNPER